MQRRHRAVAARPARRAAAVSQPVAGNIQAKMAAGTCVVANMMSLMRLGRLAPTHSWKTCKQQAYSIRAPRGSTPATCTTALGTNKCSLTSAEGFTPRA